jgi:hypothetical protein
MSKVYLKRVKVTPGVLCSTNSHLCYFIKNKTTHAGCSVHEKLRAVKDDFCDYAIYIPATPEEIERYKQRHGE